MGTTLLAIGTFCFTVGSKVWRGVAGLDFGVETDLGVRGTVGGLLVDFAPVL